MVVDCMLCRPLQSARRSSYRNVLHVSIHSIVHVLVGPPQTFDHDLRGICEPVRVDPKGGAVYSKRVEVARQVTFRGKQRGKHEPKGSPSRRAADCADLTYLFVTFTQHVAK